MAQFNGEFRDLGEMLGGDDLIGIAVGGHDPVDFCEIFDLYPGDFAPGARQEMAWIRADVADYNQTRPF